MSGGRDRQFGSLLANGEGPTDDEPHVPDDQHPLVSIKKSMIAITPDELDRQLPNLVDTVRQLSDDHSETIGFRIGISFTTSLTPLDYSIEHLQLTEDGGTRIVQRKEAITDSHEYITFDYPRDPKFSQPALRAAILTHLQTLLAEQEDAQTESQNGFLSFLKGLF